MTLLSVTGPQGSFPLRYFFGSIPSDQYCPPASKVFAEWTSRKGGLREKQGHREMV
jgi:hypothetical protein